MTDFKLPQNTGSLVHLVVYAAGQIYTFLIGEDNKQAAPHAATKTETPIKIRSSFELPRQGHFISVRITSCPTCRQNMPLQKQKPRQSFAAR